MGVFSKKDLEEARKALEKMDVKPEDYVGPYFMVPPPSMNLSDLPAVYKLLASRGERTPRISRKDL